ncbi:MAG: hypothetical protein ACE1Y4_06545, partial [Lysobacterales bacterium]
MKKQYLVRTTLSGLALFILINVTVERAAADELSSAATAAMADDTAGAATVQALQQSFTQQRELLAIQAQQLERQQQQIREQSEHLQAIENQLRQLVSAQNGATKSPSEHPGQFITMASTGHQQDLSASSQSREPLSQQADATERLRDVEEPIEIEAEALPGFLQIPGTDASMKLGGFVKMSIVQSFDQVGSADRFVVGTIPVTGDAVGTENQANLTSRQSRLNLDVRRHTALGPLRAFIEGDYAGEGDTY